GGFLSCACFGNPTANSKPPHKSVHFTLASDRHPFLCHSERSRGISNYLICNWEFQSSYFSTASIVEGSSSRIHSIMEIGRLPFFTKSSWNWPRRKFAPLLS